MPKVNYLKNFPRYKDGEYPPIDWLWAAVLERMRVMQYNLSDLAAFAGVHYDTMRDHIRVSPWNWNEEERNRVCAALGIKPIRTVEGAPKEDWRA